MLFFGVLKRIINLEKKVNVLATKIDNLEAKYHSYESDVSTMAKKIFELQKRSLTKR